MCVGRVHSKLRILSCLLVSICDCITHSFLESSLHLVICSLAIFSHHFPIAAGCFVFCAFLRVSWFFLIRHTCNFQFALESFENVPRAVVTVTSSLSQLRFLVTDLQFLITATPSMMAPTPVECEFFNSCTLGPFHATRCGQIQSAASDV